MAGKKILVVDDSLTIQKVIRLALSNEGYEIQACSDGAEAIQQISLFRPDVILVDVSLPGKSAFEIKAEINQDHDLAHVKFVLMSSAFEQVDEAAAEKVEFHSRLIKPFDPAHLRQVLLDVLTPSKSEKKSGSSLSQDAGVSIQLDDDLWDTGKDSTKKGSPKKNDSFQSAPPPAHFEPGSFQEALGGGNHEESSASDIRSLTEATIKMSGLDDFHWSVNEDGKKELPLNEPALKPHPQLADTGSSSFSFDPDRPPEKIKESYGNLPLTPPPAQEKRSSSHASASPAQVAPLSSTDVEDAVRKHLENTLERMAQKMLPEIAEKVIKKEIHRLLSEIP